MAGVCQHAVLLEQIKSQIFVGTGGGDAKHDVPAGFCREARADFLRCELCVECGEIGAGAREELRLELLAGSEKRGKRVLDGSVQGEIGIGDDFETARGVSLEVGGTGERDPGALHLGKAAEFGDAAEGECERVVL